MAERRLRWFQCTLHLVEAYFTWMVLLIVMTWDVVFAVAPMIAALNHGYNSSSDVLRSVTGALWIRCLVLRLSGNVAKRVLARRIPSPFVKWTLSGNSCI